MIAVNWYVERWQPDGQRALWYGSFPDFLAVRSYIEKTLEHKPNDIVRVVGPPDADPKDLEVLKIMGARTI